ncbi:DUF6364 family protein [Deferrisoma camini]|uniref:DUF6364 family protein n=1 Tax=Deferrisoma camini TaxID=1035120 RepID=UPI00046D8E3F|nr:DUF6364 family protein [Deferrisoma camini]
MQTKLTLRMDEAVIRRAKQWAARRGVSLSKSIEDFFVSVTEAELEQRALSPWTRTLLGAGKGEGAPPTDEQLEAELAAH